MRTHSPAEAFVCPYAPCLGSKFKLKSTLYFHLKKEHRTVKSGAMRCPVDGCRRGYVFVDEEEVAYHARLHHKADFSSKSKSLLLPTKVEDPIIRLFMENLEVSRPPKESTKAPSALKKLASAAKQVPGAVVVERADFPLIIPNGSVLLLPNGGGAITTSNKMHKVKH